MKLSGQQEVLHLDLLAIATLIRLDWIDTASWG